MNSRPFHFIYFSAVIIGSAVLFFACTKDVGVLPPPVPPPPGACDTITYTKHMKPLVDTRCVICHNPNLTNGGYDFSTYADLKEASDAGKLYNSIFVETGSKKMPQGSELSAAEKDLIKCWIENGEKQ